MKPIDAQRNINKKHSALIVLSTLSTHLFSICILIAHAPSSVPPCRHDTLQGVQCASQLQSSTPRIYCGNDCCHLPASLLCLPLERALHRGQAEQMVPKQNKQYCGKILSDSVLLENDVHTSCLYSGNRRLWFTEIPDLARVCK